MHIFNLDDVIGANVSLTITDSGLDVLLSITEHEGAAPTIVEVSRKMARRIGQELMALADIIEMDLR